MIEMSDTEFIERIKAHLREKGWCTGAIGTPEGPNCLLGAAGFVAHNGDLIVDKDGISPLAIDGRVLADEQQHYEFIPGMVRLARLMGLGRAMDVASTNDRADTLDEAIELLETAIDKNMLANV